MPGSYTFTGVMHLRTASPSDARDDEPSDHGRTPAVARTGGSARRRQFRRTRPRSTYTGGDPSRMRSAAIAPPRPRPIDRGDGTTTNGHADDGPDHRRARTDIGDTLFGSPAGTPTPPRGPTPITVDLHPRRRQHHWRRPRRPATVSGGGPPAPPVVQGQGTDQTTTAGTSTHFFPLASFTMPTSTFEDSMSQIRVDWGDGTPVDPVRRPGQRLGNQLDQVTMTVGGEHTAVTPGPSTFTVTDVIDGASPWRRRPGR